MIKCSSRLVGILTVACFLASCGGGPLPGEAEYIASMRLSQGIGVPQNPGQAFLQLQTSAGKGYPLAALKLANLYRTGEGAEKNLSEALRYNEIAAEHGSVDGEYNAGLSYLKGEGTTQNFEKAAMYFDRAAHHGDGAAMFALGLLFIKGEGVPLDARQAAAWLRLAAKRNYPGAQGALAVHMQALKQEDLPVIEILVQKIEQTIIPLPDLEEPKGVVK